MRRILVLFAVVATVLAGCGGKDKDDEAGGSRAGGNKFTRSGPVNAAVWPNDGTVALQSALATDVGDPVLPHRRCYTFEDTHSIYVSTRPSFPNRRR